MEIRHLEVFLEVARQKSFSKAANELHISQPAISRAIKELEQHLAVPLFYRNTKYVELTDVGQTILEEAGQTVNSLRNMKAIARGGPRALSGKVRLGIPPITGLTTFARFFGPFKQEYPHITLQLLEGGSKKIEAGLLDESLDVGIICIPAANMEQYEIAYQVQEPLQLIVHAQHPLAGQEAVAFADLAEEKFVMYSVDFSLRDHIFACCGQAGFQPEVVCETMQLDLMVQMAAEQFGVALLPATICQRLDPGSVVAVPLTNNSLTLELGMAWKKRRYLSLATQTWLNFVAAQKANK